MNYSWHLKDQANPKFGRKCQKINKRHYYDYLGAQKWEKGKSLGGILERFTDEVIKE